jgi:undecaprenyl diphosphate synthase
MKKVPIHIGIIVDGNRRWASKKGLPAFEGHMKGFSLLKEVANWCFEYGIKFVSFYIFSIDNWRRKKDEINYLLNEMIEKKLFERDVVYFNKKNIKILVSGRLTNLPESLIKKIKNAINLTENNTSGTINFCLNYGGREEIIDALKKIINKNIKKENINIELLRSNLYHPEIPDPDLIIRTSEKRLSNFLCWQSIYSELNFIDKYWPDFTKRDLEESIKEFQKRKRRYGK